MIGMIEAILRAIHAPTPCIEVGVRGTLASAGDQSYWAYQVEHPISALQQKERHR